MEKFPYRMARNRFVLEKASASIISIEDIDHDEDRIQEMNASCRIFVVTEGLRITFILEW
jgi:hypothetical protein